MSCRGCHGDNYIVVYKEPINCPHCDEEIVIEYFVCEDCLACWKEIEGEMVKDSFSKAHSLSSITDLPSLIDALSGGSPDGLAVFSIEPETEDDSLSGMIHHCLRCNGLSYKATETRFVCSECDFSWEVIK